MAYYIVTTTNNDVLMPGFHKIVGKMGQAVQDAGKKPWCRNYERIGPETTKIKVGK